MTTQSFKSQSVIVTGASTGIGRATALAFAKQGANVVVADVNQDKAKETLKLINETGAEALFVACDVSSEQDVKILISKTIDSFGKIDVAFNNAGIEGQQAMTADCSLENFEHVIATNLKGVWLCMKYQIPEMLKNGKGAIVNCSSIAGLVGFPNIPAYVASKHGVIGLTKTAALEYAKQNIRINAVCPGAIMTPMLERFGQGKEGAEKLFTPLEPVGRIGAPEEIANAVLWLCSDQSSFVTGHALAVDGGWVAQ